MSVERAVKALIPRWSSKDLFKVRKAVNSELRSRVNARLQRDTDLAEGWHGFANVMFGVTVALACRETLRWSKGHSPRGTQPMHGACWTPSEIAEAFISVQNTARYIGMGLTCNPFRFHKGQFDPRFERIYSHTNDTHKERWNWYYSDIPF